MKVLVAGDVCGQFQSFSDKLRQLSSKTGSFDLVLCVGDFFGTDDTKNRSLLESKLNFSSPIYVLGPTVDDHVKYYTGGSDLAENVTYLGSKGLLTTADGLSIAYLSGSECEKEEASSSAQFTTKVYQELIVPITSGQDFPGVDILLTSPWPMEVAKYATGKPIFPTDADPNESAIISRIAGALYPRYHFAAMNDCFYERAPYRNHRVLAESPRQATRFIGLAKFGTKARSLYAFNIVPLSKLERAKLFAQPADTTEFPYGSVIYTQIEAEALAKKKKASGGADSAQFFYDMTAQSDKQGEQKPGQGGRGKRQGDWTEREVGEPKRRLPPAACWFCLSSPEVEKHMVISVGDSCYLALAKGALVSNHVLVLPVAHIQSIVAAPDDVLSEVDRFKTALRRFFSERKETVVFFERNFKSQHLQLQVVPLPMKFTTEQIREAFFNIADMHGVQLSALGADVVDLRKVVGERQPYFCAELPSCEKLFCRITGGKQFPLQFAREVLASSQLLDCAEKVDWRACAVGKDEEARQTAAFRKDFEKYDFTLV